jgi:hypothetical protein
MRTYAELNGYTAAQRARLKMKMARQRLVAIKLARRVCELDSRTV